MPSAEKTLLRPVPVVRAPGAGPCAVELVVGVGARDEPPHLAGISHLAEHLLIRLAGPDIVHVDGSTSVSTVTFSSVGVAEVAAGSMTRLCAAVTHVHELTDAQVALELDIIESEDAARFADVVPTPATIRFGFGGTGLGGAGTPALGSVTRDEVVAWVRERFTAEHAAVLLTGPWDGFEPAFELPASPARVRALPADPTGTPLPVAVPTALPGVAMSVVVPARLSPALDQAASHDFLQRLRMERGLTYGVDVVVDRIDAATHQLDIVLGSAPDKVREAAVAMLELARTIAERGFSELAVARGRHAAASTLQDADRLERMRAQEEVTARLLGGPAADVRADVEAGATVEGETLRAAWADALASVVLMFHEDADTGDPRAFSRDLGLPVDDFAPSRGLPVDDFDAETLGSRVWRRGIVPRRSRDGAAVVGDRLLVRRERRAWSVDLTRVAVATLSEEGVTLVSDDGRAFHVGARSVRGAPSLVAAIVARLRRIAPERVRVMPPR